MTSTPSELRVPYSSPRSRKAGRLLIEAGESTRLAALVLDQWQLVMVPVRAANDDWIWTAHLTLALTADGATGPRIALPCWLLTTDLRASADTIRRSLDRGWSLAQAQRWEAAARPPQWLAHEYGWMDQGHLWRLADGPETLNMLVALEEQSHDHLHLGARLLRAWTGTPSELLATVEAILSASDAATT